MHARRLRVLAPLLSTACFSTSYDLLSAGDERRELVTTSAAPSDWEAVAFDDSAWRATSSAAEPMAPAADGSMPMVYVRQRFDLGPDPEAYGQLTLSLSIDGVFDAFIDGVQMTGSGNQRTLQPAPGSLKASENILAIAIHPNRTMRQLTIASKLDGTRHGSTIPQIDKGPYLLLPAADGITVAWETSLPATSQLLVDGRVFDGGSQARHFVRVTGLAPGTAYPYHVEVGDVRSDEATLQTAPAAGHRVRFALFGDNRTDGNTHRRLVEALVAEAPDFIVNTGDMVGESSGDEWRKFFAIEYPLLVQTPIFAAKGNHESDYGDSGSFSRYLSVGGGSVYSGDYGDIHIAVLDSNSDFGGQARWLERDLAAAEQGGARASFVVMHFGPWCGTDEGGHGSNDDASEQIAPVARRHQVAAILSGHNHVYERGASGTLNYLVSGGGGAPLMEAGHVSETRFSRSTNHYVLVDVLGSSVHVTAKDESGFVFDEAQLVP